MKKRYNIDEQEIKCRRKGSSVAMSAIPRQVRAVRGAHLQLKRQWEQVRPVLEQRLLAFRKLWKSGSETEFFSELAFCLFTPQSKAQSCWATVECLRNKSLLFGGTQQQVSKELNRVRFRYNKAHYLLEARKVFAAGDKLSVRTKLSSFPDEFSAREWIVQNIKGLGYKEATHFLRNIGASRELAILDRHILRRLCALRVIKEIPSTLSRAVYLDVEKKMQRFARKCAIPMEHLDLLFWYMATGEVFK